MKRREAREQVFCILFEQAVTGNSVEEILQAASEARDLVPDSFAEAEAFGAQEHAPEIDQVIGRYLKGWSMQRLSKVTLALLRLAVYEILYVPEIPDSVSINEAVELAKKYGGKDDAPYVNGVLAAVVRSRQPQEKPSPEEEQP